MDKFSKGDLVRLKSGGPLMTVENVGHSSPTGPTEGAVCTWFKGHECMKDVFDTAVLEKSSNQTKTVESSPRHR